jgi:hypothetical protein
MQKARYNHSPAHSSIGTRSPALRAEKSNHKKANAKWEQILTVKVSSRF